MSPSGIIFIKLVIDEPSLGVEVDQEQQFTVDTKGAGGQGNLEVAVVSMFHLKPVRRIVVGLVPAYTWCVLLAESQPAGCTL